ncbi:hypothetical protein LX32DRAFT_242598 [Colletotrichum zoysiae]|uniref:Uncharacterized protein n=1 Tax=Colletotrichum zoysiae TaxID=1216348 RepID=A0AAD9H3B3_9PEZI|nr:hypothetical protein LX32DRAFT_242598 [Colletotrichum zoysiae]
MRVSDSKGAGFCGNSPNSYHPSGGSLPYRRRPGWEDLWNWGNLVPLILVARCSPGRRPLLACSVSSTFPTHPPWSSFTLCFLDYQDIVTLLGIASHSKGLGPGVSAVSHAQRSWMKGMQMTCLCWAAGLHPILCQKKKIEQPACLEPLAGPPGGSAQGCGCRWLSEASDERAAPRPSDKQLRSRQVRQLASSVVGQTKRAFLSPASSWQRSYRLPQEQNHIF